MSCQQQVPYLTKYYAKVKQGSHQERAYNEAFRHSDKVLCDPNTEVYAFLGSEISKIDRAEDQSYVL
jgi:hypothetical protein